VICSSGIGFDPVLDGTRLTFGFRGIYQGTALLYDHPTDSTWLHLTGECIDGRHRGRVLARLDTGRHTTWADWRALHPHTRVLAREARFVGRVGDAGYFPRETSAAGADFFPAPFRDTVKDLDGRLRPHDLVYGAVVGEEARAWPLRRLRGRPVVQETVAGTPVTVWYDEASRSLAGFERAVDGRALSFLEAPDGRRRDAETGSLWTMDGLALDGPLRGRRLRPLRGLMCEWYGWYANHKATTLWAPP
jgi:hypothetical protein